LSAILPDFAKIEPGAQLDARSIIVSAPTAESPNYVAWLLVIVFGVTCGNLLSTWITAAIVEYRVQLVAREALKAMQATMKNAARVQREASARAESARLAELDRLRQVRASDPHGMKLARECEDWKRMHQQFSSPTAASESDRSCRRYSHYLETGHRILK
jgi:hypothetical protein